MTREHLKIFKKIPQIKTERLTLRRIEMYDLSDVHTYRSDPLVSKYLLWSPSTELATTKNYLSYINSKYRQGEFYDWGIEFDRHIIGTSGFTSFDIQNNSAEIGYVLNSAFWGMGIGHEAVRAVMKYGFDALGLERIEARYLIENKASERLAEKCGMKREGILRRAIRCKGEYRDLGISAITKAEYITMK